MTRRAAFVALTLVLAGGACAARNGRPIYRDPAAPLERRVADLAARMTLDEKIVLLGGDRTGFATRPIARLNIPSMTMTDGPVGVRWEKSTAFPAGVAMAASWDPDLVGRIGRAIAAEAKAHGRDVLLGPCVNVQRVPQGGRNFESFGEDPYLASRMAVAYVRGVQEERVIATVKHFAANNQETNRMTIDARVGDRALHEIYFPAFRAAVQEAGAWAVMSAYNKLNGAWCSENARLLTGMLKREWGFSGLVMSDWGAVHSAVPTANAGCDLEMPRAAFMNAAQLLPAVKGGQVDVAVIDDKVRRILRAMFAMGVFDRHGQPAPGGSLDTPAHRQLARDAAIDSTVLLKNDGALLPLDLAALKSIAVVGPNAAVARTGGAGSSHVTPFYSVSPLEGLQKRLAGGVAVKYAAGCGMKGDAMTLEAKYLAPPGARPGAHGLLGEYFDNPDLQGRPVAIRVDAGIAFSLSREPAPDEVRFLPAAITAQTFSVRWTGTLTPDRTADYEFAVRPDNGVRVYVDDKLLIDAWAGTSLAGQQAIIHLEANHAYPIRIEHSRKGGAASVRVGWRLADSELLRDAIEAARSAQATIVFAGLSDAYEAEGFDRETLTLPADQERLIQAIAAVNPRTVVVLNSGAPIVMEAWVDRVPSVVEAWYPGQEAGNAIAAVLTGDRAPSGKLPATFLRRWEDSPAYGHFPGENGAVEYAEGIFVGYRHFDRANIEPRFAFGHGLGYTTFEYRDLAVTPMPGGSTQVTFEIANTGTRDGAEVAQIYVHQAQASVPRPIRELKAFRKVTLKPGQRERVSIALDRDALAFFDADRHQWVVEPGAFDVLIGSSSRDIRLKGQLMVK